MARYRQLVQEAPQVNTLEVTVNRAKKDLMWVLISAVVSIGSGLIIGNYIKF